MKTKTILIALLAAMLLLSGCVFGGPKKIGRNEALQIALNAAELTKDQVFDIDVELEKEPSRAWYEIDFESLGTEYEYKVDAYTGEILSSRTEP